MRNARPSESRTHVVRLILGSEVRRFRGLLPGQRVAPHRHAVDDAFRAAADRRKDDDVELCVEVVVFRDLLRVDVGERYLRVVERLAPPSLRLRGEPRVEDGDARRSNRMGFHRGRRAGGHDLEAQIRRGLLHVGRAGVPDDERPAVELLAAGVERLLGCLERRVLELVAQGRQRDVGVVIDEEDRAGVRDGAFGPDLAADFVNRRVEHLHISHADRRHVVQLGEGPAGVVVRRPLRIVRAPVLIVEQRIGDAAVRLIHADDVGAGGEGSRRRDSFLVLPFLPIPPVLPILRTLARPTQPT